MLIDIIQMVTALIAGFAIASLGEYWSHRLMHIFPKTCQFHVDHHTDGTGQGVVKELRDYVLGGLPILLLTILVLDLIGANLYIQIAWVIGCLSYAVFAAYAHQLQHDNPKLCFWLAMPVHHVHHEYQQWNHNFGIGVDWWDRIFGTYQLVNWQTENQLQPEKRGYLQVRWW
jgi:sterol desaturase/sphingolipid hydroxylase (fatty acid hydroxylase superfamily)